MPHEDAAERGASLMLTIVFLMLAFTIITVLLGFSLTASTTVNGYRTDRALRYAGDAAMEVAVIKVKLDQTLGDVPFLPANEETCGVLDLDGTGNTSLPNVPSSPSSRKLFTSGSRLEVKCGTTIGHAAGPSIFYRDVSFRVLCGSNNSLTPVSNGKITCNPSITNKIVLARARVRYDYDPGYSPSADRARVPKVVSWYLRY